MARGRRLFTFAAAAAVLVAGAAALWLRVAFGGGEPYVDLTTAPLVGESDLEVVALLDEPVGNVAVSAGGRLFVTVHPESRPTTRKLLEWRDGAWRPFPTAAFQTDELVAPLGLVVGPRGVLWVLDHGLHGMLGARLLRFDLSSDRLLDRYRFPRTVAPGGSFLQDLQVGSEGRFAFIADLSFWRRRPGVVVFDSRERLSWRRLDAHASVSPQNRLIRNPIRTMVFLGGLVAMKPGIDGIALDHRDEFLYYGAMSHDTLYRVPAESLLDRRGDVSGRVEAVSRKPLSDGFSIDVEDRVYMTDVEHGAVMTFRASEGLQTLVKSPRIRWADALSFDADGYLYLADSAIPEQVLRSKSNMRAKAPYSVFRFPGLAPGRPGQ